MSDKPNEDTKPGDKEFHLIHLRAPDFRVHHVDGATHRIEGDSISLTFYQDNLLTSHEVMALTDGSGPAWSYSTKQVIDRPVRTDLFSVRLPTGMILGLARLIIEARGKGEE